MKTATALAVIALGAILTFAVRAQTPGVNLQAAGFIVMLTGCAGLALRGRAAGWLRRRVVLRRVAAGPGTLAAEAPGQLSYLVQDPAVMASQLLEEAELAEAAAQADPKPPAAASAEHAAPPRAARPGMRPDDTMPDLAAGQQSAGRIRRSRAAAVLDDLFRA
jgi:hypothetical protein